MLKGFAPRHAPSIERCLHERFKQWMNGLEIGSDRTPDAHSHLHSVNASDEIGVSDHFVERTVKAIMDAARTGEVGDGKILVVPVEKVYRIDRKSTRLNSSH